jgi:glycosyltransferase involved in cell wall biosynthesis
MKVLIVTTSYPNPRNIASGQFVRSLAEAVDAHPRVSSVGVIAPSVTGIGNRPHLAHSIPVHYFRYAPNKVEILAQLPGGVPAALRKSLASYLLIPLFLVGMLLAIIRHVRGCDIVLAQWSICGFVTGIVCMFSKTRLVTTLHGEDVRNALHKPHFRLIMKGAMRWSADIVCVSHEMQQTLVDEFPADRDRIHYISNGVSSELLDLEHAYSDDGPLRIILVASLIPIKSVDHAIAAVRRLVVDEQCDVTLTIVGDGILRDDLTEQIRDQGLVGAVSLPGVVDHDQLIKQYAGHDVLLITSREEGRSTVVLEAMAAALAVVGSNVKGVR